MDNSKRSRRNVEGTDVREGQQCLDRWADDDVHGKYYAASGASGSADKFESSEDQRYTS